MKADKARELIDSVPGCKSFAGLCGARKMYQEASLLLMQDGCENHWDWQRLAASIMVSLDEYIDNK